MTTTAAKPRDLALIVLSPRRPPVFRRLARGSLRDTFSLDDELFTEVTADDFFGFYNWLRPEPGKIIGLHVLLDASEVRDLGTAALKGVETISPPEWDGQKDLRILFGSESDFNERLSLDQDFGGNGIFQGASGSIALLFNAPPEGDEIVQGSALGSASS